MKQNPGTQVIQCTLGRLKPVKAALVVFGGELEVIHDPQLVTENIASAIIKVDDVKIGVVSVYFEGDQPLTPYLNTLKATLNKLHTHTPNTIIGGDINAWSQWWGSNSEDHRGAEYNSFLNEQDLQILNRGQVPTFETYRGDRLYASIVDVTVCSLSLLDRIEAWKVDRTLTSSDHNAITFRMRLGKPLEPLKPISTRIYNTRKAKWSEFRESFNASLAGANITPATIQQTSTHEKLESLISEYTSAMHQACEQSIPKIGTRKTDSKPPWWSPSLEQLRRDVLRKKRRIKNAAPSRKQHTIQEYTSAKSHYTTQATEAATASWKEFCSTQERESMWDGIYRVIRKTARRENDALLRNPAGETLSPEQSAELLASTFYPVDSTLVETSHHTQLRDRIREGSDDLRGLSADDPPFTPAELEMVLQSQNPKKAPGPDGLTADICAAAINCNREVFLALANRCLALSCFPGQWKVAHVCILRKPAKDDYTHPKSYRPIGLLSVLGKIVEKLLVNRLQWHLLPTLNTQQYGFMPQRGTEDALYALVTHIRSEIEAKKIVLLVSLDIEGAFDNAWWPAIKHQLITRRCPKNIYHTLTSYLENRKVQVNYARARSEKETTKGCVQGSIAGPSLWNLILDSLLTKINSLGVFCQAYADDVVLVFSDHEVSTLERTAERTLEIVSEWGSQNKLCFAAHKTNAMVMTRKLKYDAPIVHMSGVRLVLVKEIKLLGLTIDNKLTFNAHVSATCKKAADIYKQLACAARVTWGLNREIIRTIYVSVVEPIVLYAASAWAPAAGKLMVRNQLDSLQRGFVQKMCKAHRTVSLTSALVLSGQLPLDLRVTEASTLFLVKKGHSHEFLPQGREVERKVGYLQQPHPSKLTTTEYQQLEDFDPETLETHRIASPHIYTDGSKIEGKVGAALTWWSEGRESKHRTFRLAPHNTVFQSELYALFRATKLVRESKVDTASILSDSRSSLDLLRCPMATHQLAYDLKELVREIRGEGREVRYFWLRAHVGTPGNERADELAKKAALTKKTAPDYDKVPISFVKKRIREETVKKWQQRYESSTTGSVTKVFFPSVLDAKRITRDMVLTPALVQIFTGHGGFSSYLHRFHLKDSPACVCDPFTEETVWHLLFECPRFSHDRMRLESRIELSLSSSTLSTILEGKATRPPFLEFAQRVVSVAAAANSSTVTHPTQLQTNTQTTDTHPLTTQTTPNTHTPTSALQTPTTNLTTTIPTPTPTPTSAQTQQKSLTPKPPSQSTPSPNTTEDQSDAATGIISSTTLDIHIAANNTTTTTQQPGQDDSIPSFLAWGAPGEPGIRLRGVALFMNRPQETLGVSFCRVRPSKPKMAIPPGLAALINGSTTKTSIQSKKYTELPTMEILNIRCRVMRFKDKRIVLLEWREETPFVQASSLLQRLGLALGNSARTISVDAMAIDGERGEVADRLGCIRAAEVHEVIVYEDRGESLSYLKPPKSYTVSPSATLSGSARMQQKIAEDRERQTLSRSTPTRREQESGLLAGFKTSIKTFIKTIFSDQSSGSTHSNTAGPSQGEALSTFLRKSPRETGESSPKKPLTRADKGQACPPNYIPVTGPSDHIQNAFLEFVAVVRSTKQVNTLTCKKILQSFNLPSEGLLRVLLEEAEAAVYDNSKSTVIKGCMKDSYMAAYNATVGFVTKDKTESERKGKTVFHTPDDDPIVVVARCTEIMLDDKILEMAQTISGTATDWTIQDIKWVNGVPGCGKTTWVVSNFDGENDVVITTTTEAAKDLRAKLFHRIGNKAKTKVRTMASALSSGFKKRDRCHRLLVDEALMNHFGAIVMAAKLSGADEVVLIGDVNQLPYLDRENLFPLRYTRPGMVASITQELLCTHRNPMDVAYALSDVYGGIYSSKTCTSKIRSLGVYGFTGADIPKKSQNTLFLVHTQEEKSILGEQGYGSGEGSRILTIHESQGLTYERVVIMNSRTKRIRVHDSVPHAVVAVSRHVTSCVYYTDDADDAIGRFIKKAAGASAETVVSYNLKTAIQHRNMAIVEALSTLLRTLSTPSIPPPNPP